MHSTLTKKLSKKISSTLFKYIIYISWIYFGRVLCFGRQMIVKYVFTSSLVESRLLCNKGQDKDHHSHFFQVVPPKNRNFEKLIQGDQASFKCLKLLQIKDSHE